MTKMMIVKPVVLARSPTALPENIEPRESFEDTLSKILEISELSVQINEIFKNISLGDPRGLNF